MEKELCRILKDIPKEPPGNGAGTETCSEPLNAKVFYDPLNACITIYPESGGWLRAYVSLLDFDEAPFCS